jgi:hypothetical protein
MVTAHQQSVSRKRVWAIAAWLIVGPYLFSYVLIDILDKTDLRLPLIGDDSIAIFEPTTLGSAVVGLSLFLLPVPLWKRVLAFVLYAPIAGVVTLIVSLSVGCYLFHSCL